eukprot:950476-Pyramimonas_sp.AAC.1
MPARVYIVFWHGGNTRWEVQWRMCPRFVLSHCAQAMDRKSSYRSNFVLRAEMRPRGGHR